MGGLLPVASPQNNGLSKNDMCVAFSGDFSRKAIKITPTSGYNYIRLEAVFYTDSGFSISTIIIRANSTGTSRCRIEGPASSAVSIKYDSNSLYININSNAKQASICLLGSTIARTQVLTITTISDDDYNSLSLTDVASF